MAILIEESEPFQNYTRDELIVRASSEFYVPPIIASGHLKLTANATNEEVWRLQCPLFDITMQWVTVLTDSGTQCLIGASVLASHTAAVAWLNSNYYFSRHFVATLDGGNNRVNFVARKFGSNYNFNTAFFVSANTVLTRTLGTNPVNNLQVLLSVWKKVAGVRTEIVAEHVAPVIGNENEVEFWIEGDLNPQTEFVAPDIVQDEVTAANTHVFVYDIALADLSGSPPIAKALRFYGPYYGIRGGSRFENQISFGDFFGSYMISELNGTLSHALSRKATLEQELYTYWYNNSAGNNYAVQAFITFTDNSTKTGIVNTFAGNGRTVYIIPSGIANTDVEALCIAEGKTLADIKTVVFSLYTQISPAFVAPLGTVEVVPDVFNQRYFLFENSAGGAEVMRFTGETSESLEVEKSEYRQLNIPSRYWERRTLKNDVIQATQTYECATGLLTEEELYQYIDILFSSNVWEISYEGGNYRFPIKISPGTFVLKKDVRDGVYVYGFSFAYTRAYTEKSNGLINNFY